MKKRILVAPLNWGIGHATRCIPIINALIENNFEPIIASDGYALQLLKTEFPDLTNVELASYNIKYTKKSIGLKWKLITQIPKTLKAIRAENKQVESIIKDYKIRGIISDNRFGIYSKKVPSIFITHQLNVLSGNTSFISSKLNQLMAKKFDEIWVPDFNSEPNLSGKLGHLTESHSLNLKYIGPLSRFKKLNLPKTYDLMVLLSGPEPQRTILEEKLLQQLTYFDGKILFVKGKIEAQQTIEKKEHFTIYNFMLGKPLEEAINKSNLILSRSGYTTVMDLGKLNKKAFFIPTPGQFEQDYLAKRLDSLGFIPYCHQDNFTVELLDDVKNYKGLNMQNNTINFIELFGLF